MEPDVAHADGGREIRLEGGKLAVFVGLILAVVVTAFLLGRWSAPQAPATAPNGSAATADGELPKAPVQGGAGSHFDTATGADKAPEPSRQVASKSAPVERTPVSQAPPLAPGAWVVQVFAGRDREAAEALVRGLGERGYPVRIDSEREGADQLFKVRIGGYPTQTEANTVADRLRREGDKGAWVTRVK
jgi:cell division septation protein DedD